MQQKELIVRNFLLIVALVVGMGLGVAAYPYIQGVVSGVMSVYNAETAKKDVEEKKEIKDDKKTDNDRVAKVENKKTEDDGKIADKEQPKERRCENSGRQLQQGTRRWLRGENQSEQFGRHGQFGSTTECERYGQLQCANQQYRQCRCKIKRHG